MKNNNVFNKFHLYPNFFSYRFVPTLRNDVILIKHGSFFRKKFLYNFTVSNFLKCINYYQIQKFVYKNFVLENLFLMVLAIKEFVSKN